MQRIADRPRRSLLFMPGANSRALDKARELPADGLIFDLEDAVAPDAKAAARDSVGAAVRQGGYGRRELVLRVNALDTEWGAGDLAAAAAMPVDAVLLPKGVVGLWGQIRERGQARKAKAIGKPGGKPDGKAGVPA